MKFALVTLYVENMEKSLEFYNKLLEIPIVGRHKIESGEDLVFMGMDDGVKLELISSNGKISYSGFSIGFEVDDLPAIKERLNVCGYSVKREMSPNNSTTLYFLTGPNGEDVELIGRK
ncbi:MAG: VOC family protein [Treponema sp.]|nr:VOC family protein [Treponema sp.]